MTIIDGDNVLYDETKALDNTDSPYTTSGEEIYTVDTTSGVLTVELATADTTAGFHKRLFDVGGNIETNAVTISTEGSENVDGAASVTWDHNNGSYLDLWSDGTDWFTSLQAAADALGLGADTITDFTGTGLSVSGGTLNAAGETVTAIDDTDSPFTTSGDDIILADTTNGAITVTLATADAGASHDLAVVDVGANAATNNITINTEGAGTIDGSASITIATDRGHERLYANGTNWFSQRFVDDLTAGTVTAVDADITGGAVIGDYHWASKYDGADADARLGNALSAAAKGDVIYLENASYASSRTFSSFRGRLIGSISVATGEGTELNAAWTLNTRVNIQGIMLGNAGITVGASNTHLSLIDGSNQTITVDDDKAIISDMLSGSVTFNSGTSGGLVDTSTGVTVTDNGTNTTGDNA